MWGSSAIFVRLGLSKMPSTTGTLFSLIVSFVLIMVITLVLDYDSLWTIPTIAFGWLALLGVTNYAFGRLMNFSAVNLAGVNRATPLISISPLISTLLALLFLDERPPFIVVVGTVATVAGVVLIVSERRSVEDSSKRG
jgi:drug/metabolite transporter (DMT)-like permease